MTTATRPLSSKQLQARVDRLAEKKGRLAAELKATADALKVAQQDLKDARLREKAGNGAAH